LQIFSLEKVGLTLVHPTLTFYTIENWCRSSG